jgi:hypothetical protein
MSDNSIENHHVNHVVMMTHELRIDGHHLIEKKHKLLIQRTDRLVKTLVLIHIRSIDDKSYKVTESNNFENDDAPETQVETDWRNLKSRNLKKTGQTCGIWAPFL